MQENAKLKKRVQVLNSIRSSGLDGSSNKIEEHKDQLRGEFERFKDLSAKEIQRLRYQHENIDQALEIAQSELNSERPGTGDPTNLTMTSNFSMRTVDVEELRQ